MLQMFDNDPKHEPEQAPAQYDDVDDVGVGEPIVMSVQALVTQIGPKVLSWFAYLPLTCG